MTNAARLQHFVGGQWRQSAGDRFVPDRNPSDADDVIGLVPAGSPEDVEMSVASAAEAGPAWRNLTGPARAEHLYRWAAAIAGQNESLAQAMAREVGKPITEARGEVARGVAILRYYAGEAVREIGQVIPSQFPHTLQFTLRQPLGVVALITPWNFPFAIPLWKAAPALAFGNTVVWKPAESASHMATLLAETAAAAGLPPGVFNVLLGSGSVIGDPLLGHAAVAAVSFTGSSAVGARVAAAAAARNIRFQTEMGGKNVAIVLPDADLDVAATLVAGGAMRFAGQKCTATSRAVVVGEVEDSFLKKLGAQVEALPLGPVTDPAAAVGPMISGEARQAVIETIKASGAKPIFGGSFPKEPAFSRGHFLTPTVITADRAGLCVGSGGALRSRRGRPSRPGSRRSHRARQPHALWPLRVAFYARHQERARLHPSHRGGPGQSQRRYDRSRSARPFWRDEGLVFGLSRTGTRGPRVLHGDQNRTGERGIAARRDSMRGMESIS